MLPLPSSGQIHYTVAFSPCGRWLAAGGGEWAVDVWDLHAPQNRSVRRLSNLGTPIVRLAFAPAGELVVVTTAQIMRTDQAMWNIVSTRHTSPTHRAVVAPDGESVVVCGGAFQRWTTAALSTSRDWTQNDGTSDRILDLSCADSGLLFAIGATNNYTAGFLELRAPNSGRLIESIPLPASPHRVACSADGALVAVLATGNLSVWNLTTRTAIADRTSPKHGGWLSVAFDPRGRRIVTGGIDSTVAVWDATSTGPPITTFQWGVGPVYTVTFDRDGLRAAAAGHSGAVVWDVDE